MNKIFLVATLLGVALFQTNCTNTEKKGEIVTQKLSDEDAKMAEIQAIEKVATESAQVASSLRYSKENGESVMILAFLKEDGKVMKIEEQFNEGNNGNFGKIFYYMKDDNLFSTREYFEDHSNNEVKFVERISFYDSKGKIEKTIEKRVNFEDELEQASFKPVELRNLTIDRAMQVLDQKGAFQTTFQGFIASDDLTYLILGEPTKDGFTTALRADQLDAFILELRRNEKKHLNRKVRVNFEVMQDPNGFEFQQYIIGEFAE
jgi:hypothetical protein